MKLTITEEDHQFIESIVERFDPAKLINRQDGVSDEDWDVLWRRSALISAKRSGRP